MSCILCVRNDFVVVFFIEIPLVLFFLVVAARSSVKWNEKRIESRQGDNIRVIR